MPNTVYFITPSYVKTYAVGQSNATDATIAPLIKTSAELWCRPALGTYFYNSLLSKANAGTLNSDETTLVNDYISPALAWRTGGELVIQLSFSVRNKGVQAQSGDFSVSPDFSSIGYLQGVFTSKSQYYFDNMATWLKTNKDLFPDFTSPLNNDSSILGSCKEYSAFSSGMIII